MNLNIIYTPEVQKLVWLKEFFVMPPKLDSTASKEYRDAYNQLALIEPNLPRTIGIITLEPSVKAMSRALRAKYESPQTNYIPLEILRKACDILDKKWDDPLAAEYACRSLDILMYDLISYTALYSDVSSFACASNIPIYREAVKEGINTLAPLQRIAEIKEEIRETLTTLRTLETSIANPTILHDLYEREREKFERHKVSRQFPLYCSAPSNSSVLFFVGSYYEEIEYPQVILEIKDSQIDIPESMLLQFAQDKFANAERKKNLEDMLNSLPEPRTIITDIYLLNHVPELSNYQFKTNEFKPAQTAQAYQS